jgi:cytochrome c553
MKRTFILLGILCLVGAGCGRGDEPAPSAGVESGQLPPGAEESQPVGEGSNAANPAETVPGAKQEQPAEPPPQPRKQQGSSAAKNPEPKREDPKQPSDTGLEASLVSTGRAKFGEVGCKNCHAVGGEGGKIGPALDGVGAEHADVQFYLDLFADPAKMGKKNMPSFAHLAAADLRALAEYMRSLR